MLQYKLTIAISFLLFSQLTATVDSSVANGRVHLFQVVGGYNYSSFTYDNSEWGGNYSIGAIINLPISETIIINPTILFSRSTTIVRNLKGSYFESDYLYLLYYDQEFDATFTDLILFFNYKLNQIKSFTFETGFGLGYSFANEDFSKITNRNETDQIIQYAPNYSTPIYSPKEDFSEKSSGITYNADLIIRYARFSISIIYIFKRGEIRYIDNLHMVSFLLGIKF
jgi:hypothetical protein